MSINVTDVTGMAVTGLTTPGYTVSADYVPNGVPGKQWIVSALTGTQAGVTPHTVSSPFTITFEKPKVVKTLGQPNPVTGVIANVGMNTYKVRVRKGVIPLAGQAPKPANFEFLMNVPAGSDLNDQASLKAALSCMGGLLTQQADAIITLLTAANL